MLKLLPIICICFLFISCTNEIKNHPTGVNNKNISNIQQADNQKGFEIIEKMDRNILIKTFLTYSSQACYGGDILLEENGNKKIIFQSREAGNNIFPYCSPSIKKISENTVNIYICYESGGGSGECGALLFEYNIQQNIWTYISHGNYNQGLNPNYTSMNTNLNSEKIKNIINYMTKKGYNVK